VSTQILNTFYKRSIKEDVEPARIMKFYKITLGCDAEWVLIPLQELERRGYFE
jgi:hypothetical protein